MKRTNELKHFLDYVIIIIVILFGFGNIVADFHV